MSSELQLKYLDDPNKYCEKITALLEQNSEEWQHVWKSAIPELWNIPEQKVSLVNALLKVVETAFKSRDYNLRSQAFECWQYFIIHCEKLPVSEKLLNVILIPLAACNHSVYMVLNAKLKTWNTLVDTNLITKPNIMKKAISNLLKFLYGPHPLDTACSFAALSESCGQIYHKIMQKCAEFEEQNDLVLSYLEKAIPPLSNMKNSQKLAKLIWSDALKNISQNKWNKRQFTYLMRTLENLISDNKNDGYELVSGFLSIFLSIYSSFPPDRLIPHMNLVIRCLFHPPVNNIQVLIIMENLLKKCESAQFFFDQMDIVLREITTDNKDDLEKLWIAVVTCYSRWVKKNNLSASDFLITCKILLFPVKYMSDKCNADIMEHWKLCYEECISSAATSQGSFEETLLKNLEILLKELSKPNANVPVSVLITSTAICKTMLMYAKHSATDGIPNVRKVLLLLGVNLPNSKTFTDKNQELFVAKCLATVMCYLKLYPAYKEEFSPVFKNFQNVIKSEENELTILQSFSKVNGQNGEENCNEVIVVDEAKHNSNDATTPVGKIKLRSSFLARLSPSDKKSSILDASNKNQATTPKTSKSNEDNVQYVSIKPKSKNSPMTAHQREKAESKPYIPALYQDLSQSQSQSHADSVSLLSGNKKSTMGPFFEENAILPSVTSKTKHNDNVQASLSFQNIILEKSSAPTNTTISSSKKSLFNEKHVTIESTDSNSCIDDILEKKISEANDKEHGSAEEPMKKPSIKRKSSRISNKIGELPPTVVIESSNINIKDVKEVNQHAPKKRGRKSKSLSAPVKIHSDEVVNLIDLESQSVFVPKLATNSNSASANSLMDVKSAEEGTSTRRKSLRARKTSISSRSPVVTRKRKSTTTENEVPNSNKSLFSENSTSIDIEKNQKETIDDSTKSETSKSNNKKRKFNTSDRVEQSVENANADITQNIRIILESPKMFKSPLVGEFASTVKTSTMIPALEDSVVLIEDSADTEIISLDDSLPCSVGKGTQMNSSVLDIHLVKSSSNGSDESTFFDTSQVLVNNNKITDENPSAADIAQTSDIGEYIENTPEETRKDTSENNAVSEVRNMKHANTTQENLTKDVGGEKCSVNSLVQVSVEIVPIEDTQISPIEDTLISPIEDTPIGEIVETSPKRAEYGQSDSKKVETSPTQKTSEESLECGKEMDSNEAEKNTHIDINEKHTLNASALVGNSRLDQIMKLACIGKNVIKSPNQQPKPITKVSKSPRLTKGGSIVPFLKNSSQRASQIIRLSKESDNGVSVVNTSPPKTITASAEKLRYFPRECTSPGILKRPDANLNICSPKSPKFVNFADRLTVTREFYKEEEDDLDSLISTGEDSQNDNVIGAEECKTQDMLYSPLQNCRDDVRNVVEYLFSSSWSEQALDHLHRMGIHKIGQLASMCTVTAKSIPAGDNRIQRLRNALKKYDESIATQYEKRGLRRPSARKRILKSPNDRNYKLEVSSLIELLDEAEPAETELSENAEIEVNVITEENSTPEVTEPGHEEDQNKENLTPDCGNSSPVKQSISTEISKEVSSNDGVGENNTELNDEQHGASTEKMSETAEIPSHEREVVAEQEEEKHENQNEIISSDDGSDKIEQPVENNLLESFNLRSVEDTQILGNDSVDYVCTGNEEDTGDRTSLIIKNIRRYSAIPETEEYDKTPDSRKLSSKITTSSPEIVDVVTDELVNTSEIEKNQVTAIDIPKYDDQKEMVTNSEKQDSGNTIVESASSEGSDNSVSIFSTSKVTAEEADEEDVEMCNEPEISPSLIENSKSNENVDFVSFSSECIENKSASSIDEMEECGQLQKERIVNDVSTLEITNDEEEENQILVISDDSNMTDKSTDTSSMHGISSAAPVNANVEINSELNVCKTLLATLLESFLHPSVIEKTVIDEKYAKQIILDGLRKMKEKDEELIVSLAKMLNTFSDKA